MTVEWQKWFCLIIPVSALIDLFQICAQVHNIPTAVAVQSRLCVNVDNCKYNYRNFLLVGHLTDLTGCTSSTNRWLLFLNYAVGILQLIDRSCPQQRLMHHIYLLAVCRVQLYAQVHILVCLLLPPICWPAAWEWRRREVHCSLNFVCLPGFHVGLFAGDGLFSCRVLFNTRVLISIFAASLY